MKKPIIEEEVTYDNFKIIEVNGRQIGKSHVSEMIDALIELLQVSDPKRNPKGTGLARVMDKVHKAEEALKKAGVEL